LLSWTRWEEKHQVHQCQRARRKVSHSSAILQVAEDYCRKQAISLIENLADLRSMSVTAMFRQLRGTGSDGSLEPTKQMFLEKQCTAKTFLCGELCKP
jgi:hypothetical protein